MVVKDHNTVGGNTILNVLKKGLEIGDGSFISNNILHVVPPVRDSSD